MRQASKRVAASLALAVAVLCGALAAWVWETGGAHTRTGHAKPSTDCPVTVLYLRGSAAP